MKRSSKYLMIIITLLVILTGISGSDNSDNGASSALRALRLRLLILTIAAALAMFGTVMGYSDNSLSGQLILRVNGSSDTIYLQSDKSFIVDLYQQSLTSPAAGYQASLSFDSNMLSFVSGSYTDSPYGQPTIYPITQDAGQISLGATTLPEQSPSSATAKLASLTFLTGSSEGSTQIMCHNARIYSMHGDTYFTQIIDSPSIVIDNTPPVISTPLDITEANDTGLCQASISIRGPTVTDDLSGVDSADGTRSDNKPLSDPYPVGTTSITWTAIDKAGNSAQCIQTITVTDTEKPIITAPASVTVKTDPLCGYASKANVNLGTPVVSDNCGIAAVINDAPDQFPAGTTTVTWTATDVNGNSATAAQSVTVYDNRPIIVFREDDCRDTWRNVYPEFDNRSAYDYGKLKKIPVTWAIISSLSSGQGPLNWTEIKNYLDIAGGEAASHSVNHIEMQTQQDYINEIINSKQAINTHLGPKYECTTFIQPGSWTRDAYMDGFPKLDNPIGQAIQANYEQSMGYLMTSGWMMGDMYYKYGLVSSMPIDYPYPTLDKVIATLDVVAATPGIIHIVYCHGIQSPTGTTSYAVRSDLMRAVMDKLALLRDSGQVRLLGLHDAYNNKFSPDINRVPNAGFETFTQGYSEPCIPWAIRGNTSAVANLGRNNSRCIRIAGQNAGAKIDALLVNPGRYKYSWYQKCEAGYPLTYGVGLMMDNYGSPYATTERKVVNYQSFYNTKVDEWQQMSAVVRVRDRLAKLFMDLYTSPPASCLGSFLIDDVSCVSAPLDPAISPTNLSLVPDPDGCTISWNTPDDSSIQNIECRYGTKTHPQTLAEGTSIGAPKAVPGRQSIWYRMNWANTSLANTYYSVFAVRSSGASEPDIDYLIVDKTPPTVSSLSINVNPDATATVSWVSTDLESSVFTNQYAVGTNIGGNNIVNWTGTTATSVSLANLPAGRDIYFSVKSQNVYGFWNQAQVVSFRVPDSVLSAHQQPDGASVAVSGIVTAIYSDCYYIEQTNIKRGIKVLGGTKSKEGDTVNVAGIIITANGERVILAE